MRQFLSEYEELQLINDYKNNLSYNNLILKYDLKSKWYIQEILKKYNISMIYNIERRIKKYFYDMSFFKTIDTEEKAYWLGFLMADGFISKKGNLLQLRVIDKDIIEKLQKSLKTNSPIKEHKQKGRRLSYELNINSQEIVKDIGNFGVINNKTYRTYIPEIQLDLISHFIRGYFDGDGTIYIRYSRNKPEPSITSSSKMVLEQMIKYLNNNNIDCYLYENKKKTFWNLVIGTKGNNSMNFLNYIYLNSNIYMDRKFNKYQLIKNKINFWVYLNLILL